MTVEPIIPTIFQRTKATCFAYGQTGVLSIFSLKPDLGVLYQKGLVYNNVDQHLECFMLGVWFQGAARLIQ